MTLEETAGYFDSHPTLAVSGTHTPPKRTPFGLAPWHRRASVDSNPSVSSSVREILMGREPVVTPNPEAQYAGRSGEMYAKGEILRSLW